LDVARVNPFVGNQKNEEGEECSYNNILVLFFPLIKTIDAKTFNISVAQPSPKFCYTTNQNNENISSTCISRRKKRAS
jgi:hypothetical protein